MILSLWLYAFHCPASTVLPPSVCDTPIYQAIGHLPCIPVTICLNNQGSRAPSYKVNNLRALCRAQVQSTCTSMDCRTGLTLVD